MRFILSLALAGLWSAAIAASSGPAPAAMKSTATVDPQKDLPRYPAVEPKDAVATWKTKAGFKLELAANEPQVRDPIAITFDEKGRMFVCEMIDYSERREVTPHLGRISLLEDKDGDGVYETSTVFADDLPWPTGLIWANGGLYVGATPDIWRFEDRDGDGRAEVREKIFTGFGTGLKALNVQTLLNSFQWGQDNRIHVQSANGNRGKIKNLKRPDLPEEELAARDFWFDPRTYEFGFEAGGAQYGMSFDNYGRKFACSNSDHLQFWVYDDRYAGRNPFFTMPATRRSIAADGGAAEVFRISPDESWRIVRTRWRIGGVVKGMVEGGGRVSGYFTGATGTTVYRGDGYGADFLNNTFTGDAGGQLVHRKKIYPDGVSLIGRRPDDELTFEFAASTDTWVRAVNFANAPDGCLYLCDMYREVIEHPWSIPTEIKQYLDLNNGNDRGRIYRIAPSAPGWKRRALVPLGAMSTAELVATLEHPNGWHRDTASRLLYERQDQAAVPLLRKLVRDAKLPLARHHALGALDGLNALDDDSLLSGLADNDEHVRERAIVLTEKGLRSATLSPALAEKLAALADDPAERVCFQLAFTLPTAVVAAPSSAMKQLLNAAYIRLAVRYADHSWISAALLSGPPDAVAGVLFPAMTRDVDQAKKKVPFVAKLVEIRAASKFVDQDAALLAFVAQRDTDPLWLRALGEGLQRAGTSIEQVDTGHQLLAVFTQAAETALGKQNSTASRVSAIELLGVASLAQSRTALIACLGSGQPEVVQVAAIHVLAQHSASEVTALLLQHWNDYAAKARQAVLAACLAREERARALLEAIGQQKIKPAELSAAQVQGLAQHPTIAIAALAKTVLASVIPPSRAEVTAKYQAAVALAGNAGRGRMQYLGRCQVCHRAGGEGMALGPDLITVKTKGREALLTAILDPNKEVAPQFIGYEVNTKDGNAYSGIIARDDAAGLSLRLMGGAEIAVPRTKIKNSRSSGQSLMPEGLEAGMSVPDLADLLSFIEEQK